jgi:hypothetical protein
LISESDLKAIRNALIALTLRKNILTRKEKKVDLSMLSGGDAKK